MGHDHGEQLRDTIRELADVRMSRLRAMVGGRPYAELLTMGEQLWTFQSAHAPTLHEEFEGIRRAANLTPIECAVVSGLTDVIDVAEAETSLAECTTMALPAADRRNLLAGTWDSHREAAASLTTVRRRPKGKPEVIGLTSAGMPIQQGVNDQGVAFAVNNLKPRKAGIGILFPLAMALISEARSVSESVRSMRNFRFASGHYYVVVDEESILGLETTNEQAFVLGVDAGDALVHTNHYLVPGSHEPTREESILRLEVACNYLRDWGGDAQQLWALLGQEAEPGGVAICKTSVDDYSCAGFVIDPSRGQVDWSEGPPCRVDRPYTLKL